MKIEIRCRFTGGVLFEHDAENNTVKLTVEAAVSAGASLDGASLDGANLTGASLDGASLDGANLTGASLDGANLTRARLDGASLTRANLYGANLDGASLTSARLDGANLTDADIYGTNLAGANLARASLAGAKIYGKETLVGYRPILQVGPIGSRSDYLMAFITNEGLRIGAWCFYGTKEEFEMKLNDWHGNNDHVKEYRAALAMIDVHAEIWTPEEYK